MLSAVIATMGGSGSTELGNILRQNHLVLSKPDTLFRQYLERFRSREVSRDQGSWHARSAALASITPNDPILTARELLSACNVDSRSVVFISNTFAELRVWSTLAIPSVVFLIRHPLHAYLSWCKIGRHSDIAEEFGGPESPRLVELFTNRWNEIVEEYMRLLDLNLSPHLLRFEYFNADVQQAEAMAAIFADAAQAWESWRRNHSMKTDKLDGVVRGLTRDRYEFLYGPNWDV